MLSPCGLRSEQCGRWPDANKSARCARVRCLHGRGWVVSPFHLVFGADLVQRALSRCSYSNETLLPLGSGTRALWDSVQPNAQPGGPYPPPLVRHERKEGFRGFPSAHCRTELGRAGQRAGLTATEPPPQLLELASSAHLREAVFSSALACGLLECLIKFRGTEWRERDLATNPHYGYVSIYVWFCCCCCCSLPY